MDHINQATGLDQIESVAESTGRDILSVAIEHNSPLVKNACLWPEVKNIKDANPTKKVELLHAHDNDLLSSFAKEMGGKIQFPESTAYLHSLGCVSSAMTKSFYVKYMGKPKPVTLYVVTAQLSSTGKSAVNGMLSDPILDAFTDLNNKTQRLRRTFQRKIFAIENDLNSTKKELDDFEMQELEDQLHSYKAKLARVPKYTYALDDTTIEGAEVCAMGQSGTFNIVSAESDAITVITGGVYGDAGSKKNFNLLLKAWDGEYASIFRASREGYEGVIKASISVIAQGESIDAIMELGSSGRGIAGRFLMLNEGTMLGSRDHSDDGYSQVDEYLARDYASMVHNIVAEQDDVILDFAPECWSLINGLKRTIEPHLADGGAFDDAMITEFAGKSDKHVTKIASVIHAAEAWRDSGDKSRTIGVSSVERAVSIFKSILKNYIETADNLGYSGLNSEIASLSEKMEGYASKGKLKIRVTALVNNIKGVKPFKTSRNLTRLVKTELLPKLQDLGYCYTENNVVYINPKLK